MVRPWGTPERSYIVRIGAAMASVVMQGRGDPAISPEEWETVPRHGVSQSHRAFTDVEGKKERTRRRTGG